MSLESGRGTAWVNEHGAHLVDYASYHLEPGRAEAAVAAALQACATQAAPGGVSDRAHLLAALRRECAAGPGGQEGFQPGPGPGTPSDEVVRRAWSLVDPLGTEALRLLYRHELTPTDLSHVLSLRVQEVDRLLARTQDMVEILVSGLDSLARGRPICPDLAPLVAAVFPDGGQAAADFADARGALLTHIVTCLVCKRPINIRYTVPQILSHPPVTALAPAVQRRLSDAVSAVHTRPMSARRPPASFGMPLAAPVTAGPARPVTDDEPPVPDAAPAPPAFREPAPATPARTGEADTARTDTAQTGAAPAGTVQTGTVQTGAVQAGAVWTGPGEAAGAGPVSGQATAPAAPVPPAPPAPPQTRPSARPPAVPPSMADPRDVAGARNVPGGNPPGDPARRMPHAPPPLTTPAPGSAPLLPGSPPVGGIGQETPLYDALLLQLRAREALGGGRTPTAPAGGPVPAPPPSLSPPPAAPPRTARHALPRDPAAERDVGLRTGILQILTRVGALVRTTAIRIVIVVAAGAAGTIVGINMLGPSAQPGDKVGARPAATAAAVPGDAGRPETATSGTLPSVTVPAPPAASPATTASPHVLTVGGLRIPSVVELDDFGRGHITLSSTSDKAVKWRISAPGLVVRPSSGTLRPGRIEVIAVRALRVRYWCGVPAPAGASLVLHGPSGSGTATVHWRTC